MESCCQVAPTALTLSGALAGGLIGSLHCLGMCGPLVAVAEGMRSRSGAPWAQLPLHVGRIITYTLLGILAGLVGAAVNTSGMAVGVHGAASVLGGVAMILFALVLLGWLPWRHALTVSQGAVSRFVRGLASRRPLSGVALGLYWGLLPCGLVWGMLAGAAATGSPLHGAAVMAVFGAGTVPALLVAGGLASLLGPRVRAQLPRFAAGTVLLLGVLMVLRGAAGAGLIGHLHLSPGVMLY